MSDKEDRKVSLISTGEQVGEYDPLKNRPAEKKKLSDFGAVMHLFKSVIGAGILSMPFAFRYAGVAMGFILVFSLSFFCLINTYLLVVVSREQCKRSKVPMLDYGETGFQTCLNGPPIFHKYAGSMKFIINLFIIFNYVSLCAVYASFIGAQLKQAIECPITDESKTISILGYIAMFLPPYIVAVQFRDLAHIQYLSSFANIVYLSVIGILIYVFVKGPLTPISSLPAFASINGYPTSINIILFSIENIGTVLPIEQEMKNPERFLGLWGVFTISMGIIVLLYAFIGFFPYWRFGNLTQEIISLNLDKTLGVAVKSTLVVTLYVSYVLNMFVPLDIFLRLVKNPIERKVENKNYRTLIYTGIRTGGALLTVTMAVAVPQISAILGLGSALFLSTLAFFFPALLALISFWATIGYPSKAFLISQLFFFCFVFAVGLNAAIRVIITVDPNASFCPDMAANTTSLRVFTLNGIFY